MQKEDEHEKDGTDELLINAVPIIEGLLKAQKTEFDWRISEYLSNDEVIHLLLSYISRFPSHINIKQIHKIYLNIDNNNMDWMNIIDKDRDRDKDGDDRHVMLKTEQNNAPNMYKNNPDQDTDIDYYEKLSFSLMKILCNGNNSDNAPKELKSFLLRKVDLIVFHSLLVFHPLSFGNIYHSSQILNMLLKYCPVQLYRVLTTSHCIAIQYLFKYAISSRIHQSKFGEFFISLLCKTSNTRNAIFEQNINKYRKILIHQMLFEWHFIQNTIENANKCCLFITNLVKECAKIEDTKHLFTSPNNMLCAIIEKILKHVLDKSNHKWHKINCAICLKEIMRYISKPTIYTIIENPKTRAVVAQMASENSLFSLFGEALDKFGEYIPLIIEEIIADVTDVTDYGNMKREKVGLIKLNCFELLILYIDLIKIKNENFVIPNMKRLCKSLLNMTFIHSENNVFLSKFRAFMSVISTYCVNDLKYMVTECKMIHRFMEYCRNKDVMHCALHAYIYQILYDIYSYHEELKMIDDQELEMMQDMQDGQQQETRIEKEWNFANYVELEENTHLKEFIQMIEQEIELHEPDEDI